MSWAGGVEVRRSGEGVSDSERSGASSLIFGGMRFSSKPSVGLGDQVEEMGHSKRG
jgi:hypothetical protein